MVVAGARSQAARLGTVATMFQDLLTATKRPPT
jgi:hypothetical protein